MMALQAICVLLLAFSCLSTAQTLRPQARLSVTQKEGLGDGCSSVCLSKEMKKLHEEIQAVRNCDKSDKVVEQMQKTTDQQDLNTIARTIREVKVDKAGGKAGASSEYDNQRIAADGFKWDAKYGWATGRKNGANGIILPPPHFIWYDFPSEKAFIPAEVTFRPRVDGKAFTESPTKWQFVGTNDQFCSENSAWTVLCEDLLGIPFSHVRDIKFCKVEPQLKIKFRCLGLRLLANHGGSDICVHSVRFFEHVITQY